MNTNIDTNKSSSPRKKVGNMATQYYFSVVLERMGGITPAKLHRHFYEPTYESNSEYHEKNSRIIYKYIKGQVAVKNTDILNKIEKELPGTKQILDHPLWLILDNPSADLSQIHQYMRLLDWDTQAKLFKQDKETKVYKRKYWSHSESFSFMGMRNDIDALACFLMLIRENELLEKCHSYVTAKWFAHELFLRLASVRPLSQISAKLYDLIYTGFIGKKNLIDSLLQNKPCLMKDFKRIYQSPPFIPSLDIYFGIYKRLLENAEPLGVNISTTNEKLELLFWINQLGTSKLLNAFYEARITNTEEEIAVKKLIAAIKDTNKRKYIYGNSLFDLPKTAI